MERVAPYIISISATVLKLFAALIANKILATQLGPSMFGLWGNIFTAATFYMAFANGGINSGLIAKFSSDLSSPSRLPWLVAGILLSLGFSLLLTLMHGLLLKDRIIGLDWLSSQIVLLICLSAAISGMVQCIALAHGETTRNAIALTAASLVSVVVYAILVRPERLDTAVMALFITIVVTPVLWFAFFRIPMKIVKAQFYAFANVGVALQGLMPYVLISLAPAVLGTATILIIRSSISEQLGASMLGYWQAVFRISDAIMAMVQAAIGFVVMPAVFRAADPAAIFKKIYIKYVCAIIGVGVVYVAVALLWGKAIIEILYSSEYIPASEFLWVQAVGDIIKALCAPIVLFSIYKAKIKFNWVIEIVFSISFLLLTLLLLRTLGNSGPYYAYLCASSILLAICFFGVLRK